MTLFQFMALFSATATLIIGLFAFLSHPERRLNQSFLILTGLISLWQFIVFMGMGSTESHNLMFWIRQANAVSAFIPATMNLTRFSIHFPDNNLRQLLRKNIYWIALSLVMFVICQTNWFLMDAQPPAAGDVLPTAEYGPAFSILGIYFLVAFGRLFYLMFKSNRILKGSRKAEIEYLLLSCGTSLFLGVLIFLVPHITGWKDLGALNPISVIVFSAITGYGIATKGIMDISVLLRRIVSYTMLIIYLSLLYWVTHTVAAAAIQAAGYDIHPFASLISTLIVAFSVTPARGFAQNIANRLSIISHPLNVGSILSDASRSLNAVLTVDELCTRFQNILENNLETSEIRIFVKEKDFYTQMYPTGTYRQIPTSASLIHFLTNHPSLCVRDWLNRRRLTEDTSLMSKELKNEEMAAAIGFHRKNIMTGFILFGARNSGRVYTQEETIAIEGLRDLFAVSLENAQLYTELQNGRIYMDLLLKNLVNGVLATDASGCIITCNHEAARILDCTEGELIGKNIERLPRGLYDLQKRVLSQDIIIRDKEIILNPAEDHPVYTNAGASLFRDLKGTVIGSLMVLQDRTAIRNLEEQVKRSERLASLGTLSAGMAHEIKNPLVTLKTFTQLLPERYQDEDYRETFVNLASKEISRIDGLMNKLLTLARPVKLELKEIALNHLLEKYTKLFREQAREVSIEVIENFDADPDTILGDDDQLRQVLLNLLLNAQQAMPTGGKIELRTRNIPGYIELQIQDSGEGISPEVQNHVFDPFFTTKSAGTGLGLAVAHQILEEHHALVKIESDPGEGTTFIIRLPVPSDEVTA